MRAAERSAAGVHQKMKRGLNSLATITCVAPLLGFGITVEGIVESFVGCGGEKWTCLAAVINNLADAMTRSLLGLLVGILSFLIYRYLQGRLQQIDFEMKTATLELANTLSRYCTVNI